MDKSSADYGVDKYDIGAGFGHFGIATDDVGLRPVHRHLLSSISHKYDDVYTNMPLTLMVDRCRCQRRLNS
jgi:hypothetical protein